MEPSRIVDAALEALVVPSFTRIGHDVRSRLDHWTDLDSYDLTGRTVVVTGATSGLGRSMATTLARLGSSVVLLGRDPARTDDARAAVAAETGSSAVSAVIADMADLDAVRAAAAAISADHPSLDVVIHNAGALSAERTTSPQGIETTVAAQVVGPFLLTSLLLGGLRGGRGGRVVTMSSGGMYTAGLTVDRLQMDAASYKGAEQYARAKRAQVTLNEMWAARHPERDIVFHAAHPGWADTPGVAASLPTFRRVTGPLLRSAESGADTVVWLAADDGEPATTTGRFWHDRRPRSIHRLPSTRRTDTPERRAALWAWCAEAAGVDRP